MGDLYRMARSAIGGFGGGCEVMSLCSTDFRGGVPHVRVRAWDAFGNEATAVWPLAEWRAAVAAEIESEAEITARVTATGAIRPPAPAGGGP